MSELLKVRVRDYDSGRHIDDVEVAVVPRKGDGFHLYGKYDGCYDVEMVEIGSGRALNDCVAVIFIKDALQ